MPPKKDENGDFVKVKTEPLMKLFWTVVSFLALFGICYFIDLRIEAHPGSKAILKRIDAIERTLYRVELQGKTIEKLLTTETGNDG